MHLTGFKYILVFKTIGLLGPVLLFKGWNITNKSRFYSKLHETKTWKSCFCPFILDCLFVFWKQDLLPFHRWLKGSVGREAPRCTCTCFQHRLPIKAFSPQIHSCWSNVYYSSANTYRFFIKTSEVCHHLLKSLLVPSHY